MRVVVNGEAAGTAQADVNGAWAFDAPLESVGAYDVGIEGLDADDNVTDTAGPVTVTRLTAIETPTVSAPANTRSDSIAATGNGTAGSIVRILRNNDVAGTTQVDENGQWAMRVHLPTLGDYEIRAQALDKRGRSVGISEPANVTRLRNIMAPTLTLEHINQFGETQADSLTVSGTGTPGTQIRLTMNGDARETTTVNDEGLWSLEVPLDALGPYEFQAEALDETQAVAGTSDVQTITRVRLVEEPTLNVAVAETTADSVAVTGTGTPNTDLEIMVNRDLAAAVTVDDDGNWATEITLAELGDHLILAQARDHRGNVVGFSDVAIVTRTRAIDAPTLEASVAETTDAHVDLAGTGTPNSTIQVRLNGRSVGITQVDDEGNWQLPITLAEPGTYRIVAQALDSQGAVAGTSPSVQVIRHVVVEAPTLAVTNIDEDNETTADIAALRGTGTADATIQIWVDDTLAGTTTVDSAGNWRFDAELDDIGSYEIRADALDYREAVAGSSETVTVVRILPVVAPTLRAVNVDSFMETTDETLTVAGAGTPGATILVKVDGEAVDATEANADGRWTLDVALDDHRTYVLSAEALDKRGQTVGESDAISVTRIVPISAPTLTLTNVDENAETTDDTLAISGTGTPEAIIQIRVDNEIVGTTPVAEDGSWAFETPLPEIRGYEITADALNARGELMGTSDSAAVTRLVVIGAPTIAVFTTERLADPVILAGTGTPNSDLQLLVANEAIGMTRVDANGNWSFTTRFTEPGTYRVSAQSLDHDGSVAGTSETRLVTKAAPIVAPTLRASATEISDAAVTLSGRGTPGSVVQVRSGDTVVGTARVGSDGAWSLDTTLDDPGTFTFVADALSNGNVVASSNPVDVTRSVPAAPVSLFYPADGADILVGELTIRGRGEPDAVVDVYSNGDVAGSARVDSDGEWAYTLDVTEGDYIFAAAPEDSDPTSNTLAARVTTPGNQDCSLNPGIERGATYIVGTCDTLISIGDAFDIDVNLLIAANPQFEDENLIYPGEIVNLR